MASFYLLSAKCQCKHAKNLKRIRGGDCTLQIRSHKFQSICLGAVSSGPKSGLACSLNNVIKKSINVVRSSRRLFFDVNRSFGLSSNEMLKYSRPEYSLSRPCSHEQWFRHHCANDDTLASHVSNVGILST